MRYFAKTYDFFMLYNLIFHVPIIICFNLFELDFYCADEKHPGNPVKYNCNNESKLILKFTGFFNPLLAVDPVVLFSLCSPLSPQQAIIKKRDFTYAKKNKQN